jgi:hypothetical protein
VSWHRPSACSDQPVRSVPFVVDRGFPTAVGDELVDEPTASELPAVLADRSRSGSEEEPVLGLGQQKHRPAQPLEAGAGRLGHHDLAVRTQPHGCSAIHLPTLRTFGVVAF